MLYLPWGSPSLRGRGEGEGGKDEARPAMELWCFCLLCSVGCGCEVA